MHRIFRNMFIKTVIQRLSFFDFVQFSCLCCASAEAGTVRHLVPQPRPQSNKCS